MGGKWYLGTLHDELQRWRGFNDWLLFECISNTLYLRLVQYANEIQHRQEPSLKYTFEEARATCDLKEISYEEAFALLL